MKNLGKFVNVLKKHNKKDNSVAVTIGALVLCIFGALFFTAISCLMTCGVVYLVCLCFGLEFSWKIAVGIWIILSILKSVFKSNVNVSK